jgi:methylglutaconyl-CoA hydratase
MTAKLLAETDSRGVMTLTLNRPDKSNALDAESLADISAAMRGASGDRQTRIVLLRGAGRHFCAGADTGGIGAGVRPADGERLTIAMVCRDIATCAKPTLAVIQGACIGGAVALAAACDLAVAQEDAFFSIPEVRLGIAPRALLPFMLRGINGRDLRRYLLTGERFTAAQAQRIGLVHEIASAAEIDAVAARLTDALLMGAPGALAAAKELLDRPRIGEIGIEALAALQAGADAAAGSAEAREGIASFRERRPPAWYPKP